MTQTLVSLTTVAIARHCLLLALTLMTAAAAAAASQADTGTTATTIPRTLRVCGDDSEWPPYTFYQRLNGSKTAVVSGYNIDLLNHVLAASGRRADYSLLPWKRCLAEAGNGQFDLVMDGVKAPERLQAFLFPPAAYLTSTVYLYNKQHPLRDLNGPTDLQRIQACGQAGYIYTLPDGTQVPHLDVSAKSFDAVIRMLEQGRCELVFADMEILHGYKLIGVYDVFASGQIAAMPAPEWGRHYTEFYLMVSPALPYSTELLQLLSTGITEAQFSGTSARLLARYIAPEPTSSEPTSSEPTKPEPAAPKTTAPTTSK